MLFSCSLPHWNLAGMGESDFSSPLVTLLFYAHYTETINKLESGVGVFASYSEVRTSVYRLNRLDTICISYGQHIG